MNTKLSLLPTRDRVIGKLIDDAPTTRSGIHLPPGVNGDAASGRQSLTAIVVAVGPGHLTSTGERVPLSIAAGDRIVFDGKDSQLIRLDGQEFISLREDGVISVVRGMTPPPVDMLTGEIGADATRSTAS